jgi:hypothetical protein
MRVMAGWVPIEALVWMVVVEVALEVRRVHPSPTPSNRHRFALLPDERDGPVYGFTLG